MCDECGCKDDKAIVIDKPVTAHNDAIAQQNRRLLDKKEIFCINLMGSPGSGKTTVIEGIASQIPPHEIAVIQGDLESDIDKVRLEKSGIEAYQINTHSGCHLNASMVNEALSELKLAGKKFLIIENVGNLVCPADVRLGQHMNMVVSSTAEGSDKPLKYPIIFQNSKLIVISKMDLVKAVEFDEDTYVRSLRGINGRARIMKTSKKDIGSYNEISHFIMHEREHAFGHHHH